MTLIVGIKDKSGIFIGSDSRGSDALGRYWDQEHKIINIKNFKVGYSSSYRTAQIIKNNESSFSEINIEIDVYEFLEKLRKLMSKHGSIDKSSNKNELEHDGVYLILATRIGIYRIFSNYQYDKMDKAFIGSGENYAMGYYDALITGNTEEKIIKTIKATSKRINSVGGKVKVDKI